MAAVLKSKAVFNVHKGASSTYYNAEKNNPVLQALDQEISVYMGYMKKRSSPGFRPSPDEAISRPSDTLFELWNKYEHKLPELYYKRKLLEMGDFLVSIKEYPLALWQCYGRYLKGFKDAHVEEIHDVTVFQQAFFPKGFDAKDAGFTFRALMARSICAYQVIKHADPKLQNTESVAKCLLLLDFLRLVTQTILAKESLCWLVYNGTIHIYSISRHLMLHGHSAQVLEYLLWASMCMEGSVPLLGLKYLSWRSTLYTAVCQCYFDCKASEHAEAFAKRALNKINELSQLENMSSAYPDPRTEMTFRHATIQMATMVFKRLAFESRRRPKGLLRPKTRANLKDAINNPWPRTGSERLMVEMFEGSAAQMLCTVETLTDSNRRTLLTAPPAPEIEVEILDVYAELFLAAQEIIAGGGGSQGTAPAQKSANIRIYGMGGVVTDKDLLDMAIKGEDGVPLCVVVKIVKLAYCFEQWDVFDGMLDQTLNAVREKNDPQYAADEKALEILQAYDRVIPRTKHRRWPPVEDDSDQNTDGTTQLATSTKSSSGHDDLIHLAEVLLSIVVGGQFTQENVDIDMVVDACLLLWCKCKHVFQRYQTGSTDNPRYLQKMDNPSKWVYILDIVHQVLGWCGLSSVDPALTAEVVLRLALVFEASATLDATREVKGKSGKSGTIKSRELDDESSMASAKEAQHVEGSMSETSQGASQLGASRTSVFSAPVLNQNVRDQLVQAREILELGLANVSYARQVVALTDGKSIADIQWVKDLNPDLFEPVDPEKGEGEGPSVQGATAVWNTIKDLHLELIFLYHRVCLRLSQLIPDPRSSQPKPFKRRTCSKMQSGSSGSMSGTYIDDFDELVNYCRQNYLSKALLYMQKAQLGASGGIPTTEQKQYLQEALNLVKRGQAEERRLYVENTDTHQSNVDTQNIKKTKVPPAPILLCRTDNFMVLKPAPFLPADGSKVSWYRVFARSAAGSNVKVRLNDYYLPGTGEEIPAFNCEVKVSSLTPSERYVFAVAAYTADGNVIGDGIGESTKPILASHPLPVLMIWAYLSQVAYQVGEFGVAREACLALWNHFVAEPPPPQQVTYITSVQKDFKLTLHRLNQKVVSMASPVLLRMFLTSIFIRVDITVKEGALYCDKLCDKGPLNQGQVSRLHECEHMLLAMELAGWLNETSLALQATIQCYGLLSPLLYFKIPAIPVIQVLERCHVVLQEMPPGVRQRRQGSSSDSLHHMTACITYHMAKVLRTWGQRALAGSINDAGRKMLAFEPEPMTKAEAQARQAQQAADKDGSQDGMEGSGIEAATTDVSPPLTIMKKKKAKKKKVPTATLR